MSGWRYKLAGALLVWQLFNVPSSLAAIVVYDFDTPEQEARYHALVSDLRCPTCQNQNLAGSDAPIAMDLKQKTYTMLQDGRTDAEIRAFMTERYGDYISYKPPVRPSTWILWFFPPLLLLMALLWWVYNNRSRKPTSIEGTVSSLNADEQTRLQALLQRHDDSNKEGQ